MHYPPFDIKVTQEVLHDLRQWFIANGHAKAGDILHNAEIDIRKTLPKTDRVYR